MSSVLFTPKLPRSSPNWQRSPASAGERRHRPAAGRRLELPFSRILAVIVFSGPATNWQALVADAGSFIGSMLPQLPISGLQVSVQTTPQPRGWVMSLLARCPQSAETTASTPSVGRRLHRHAMTETSTVPRKPEGVSEAPTEALSDD
jgi:hypothetical protein